jgi:hypothetical protein
MRRSLVLPIIFLIGLVLGAAAALSVPGLARPYLPEILAGKRVTIEGEVARKQREPNRLLLKVHTAQGDLLAAFTKKVADIDVLVEPGDVVTLDAAGYAPFLEDPAIARVRRREDRPASVPAQPQ